MEITFAKPTPTKYPQITETSLAIIDTIYRYRFITTSILAKLVPAHWRTLYYHLKALAERHELIKRMPLYDLAKSRTGEFVYFIENNKPLHLLIESGYREPTELDMDRYSHGQKEAGIGRLLFIQHELMISRLHAMLELACSQSNGEIQLVDFRQGADLHKYVDVPSLPPGEGIERLPHIPDAFFTLYFPGREPGHQYESFYYEADRKTMDTTRMVKKLRAHFYAVVKFKTHLKHYNAPSIRAVLVETLDRSWAETLRQTAKHPAVSGPKPSNLFWFTASEFFTQEVIATERGKRKLIPQYQADPGLIFKGIWFSPNDRAGDSPRSILDP